MAKDDEDRIENTEVLEEERVGPDDEPTPAEDRLLVAKANAILGQRREQKGTGPVFRRIPFLDELDDRPDKVNEVPVTPGAACEAELLRRVDSLEAAVARLIQVGDGLRAEAAISDRLAELGEKVDSLAVVIESLGENVRVAGDSLALAMGDAAARIGKSR